MIQEPNPSHNMNQFTLENSRLPTEGRIVATSVITLPIPFSTEGKIVATMGLVQAHNPGHNIDEFTYEHILSDTTWLSNCNWMFKQSKSIEQWISYIIVLHSMYISYPYQAMIINDDQSLSISFRNQVMMIIDLS